MVARRKRPPTRTSLRQPTLTSLQRQVEELLGVIEQNTARISRLEDVFALHVRQREEVTEALQEIRARLATRRR